METTAKVRSVRATDDVFEKFKTLSADFPNQSEALNSLISAWEMQQARAVITERATEIDDYDSHLHALQSAFLHSLELNENAENRIRQEFRTMLDSKDATIADLQKRLEQAESEAQAAQNKAVAAEDASAALQAKLESEVQSRQAAERAAAAAEAAAADKQKIIENMTKQISALDGASERIAAAEAKAAAASAEAREAEAKLTKLQSEAELAASKAALDQQQAVLTARQEAQDRIGLLMEENHKLLNEIAELKSNTVKNSKR